MTELTVQARPGVLERGGRTLLVDYLHWFGERVGHLRELVDHGRWRWLVYEPAGDYVGDEGTRDEALFWADRCLAERWWAQENLGPLHSELRQVGPSSRHPGAGPNIGVVHVRSDGLSPAEREARAMDCHAWILATGEERAPLRRIYEQRWCSPLETP